MQILKKHVLSFRIPIFSVSASMAICLNFQTMKRWDIMLIDLHYACLFLNPFLMDIVEIQMSNSDKHVLNKVLQKLGGPIKVDFNEFMNKFI
jgi:hypothetical protein